METALRAVDIRAIENELRNLWKEMAETSDHAVMRACVLNLLVYTSGQESDAQLSQIVADVSIEHPSRILVINSNEKASETAVHAWVTALCHFRPKGRQQVCCEQIFFRAEGDSTKLLPSAIRQLLIPDLPVVLWWRDKLDVNAPLFQEFVESATRVILDSASMNANLSALAQYVKRDQEWTAFSDLNWARLTPWRLLISSFFDVPDCRSFLARIDRIQIEFSSNTPAIPAAALLLVGWIASRLKWKPVTKPAFTEANYRLDLVSESHQLAMEIIRKESSFEGIHAIKILIGTEPSGYFHVSVAENGMYLKTNTVLAGIAPAPNITRFNPVTEAELIERELEIVGHDEVYEQALNFHAGL